MGRLKREPIPLGLTAETGNPPQWGTHHVTWRPVLAMISGHWRWAVARRWWSPSEPSTWYVLLETADDTTPTRYQRTWYRYSRHWIARPAEPPPDWRPEEPDTTQPDADT
jgi:hypothetical protein